MTRPSPARLLAAGALTTAIGLAVASTTPLAYGKVGAQQVAGGITVAIGWVVLAWGIHRLGRSSED